MKAIVRMLLFIMISCKSQSPIYTFGDNNIPSNIPNNAYIKDTNNILNKFTGIWKYESNGKTFVINLQKIMVNFTNYYVDELNGYYKYINGTSTIVDTSNFPVYKSKITGRWFRHGNLNKVTLFFVDPERPRMSCEVDLTYSNTNGVEKLQWNLRLVGLPASRDPNMNPATDFRVPTNVELIKQ